MRLIIATATAGAGHLQAAAALEEMWRQLRPQDEAQKVDVLTFTANLYRKAYADGYLKLAEHAPELYELLFKKTDNPALMRRLTRFRRTASRAGGDGFLRLVKKSQPEVVICTHFLPAEQLGNLRAKSTPSPKVVSVVTDFEAHALWQEPGVDLYCVAAQETKARLVARGVPAANVQVTGIPVAARFSAALDANTIRKQLGLRDDLPVLLVLSGGFGCGPVAQILRALNQYEAPVQILVVCGRNEELRRELALLDHRHPTRVLGFVTNMHELMTVATLILTKPGGLTSSEALAIGRPLLIINPIPGQEAANSDFLLEHGAAAKVNRVEDLPFKISQVLESKILAHLTAGARALGRPQAAQEICRLVAERFSPVAK